MKKHRTIAIDGPAGAGKSTIAKHIATDYGIIYVDTGAMYRATALHMMHKGIDLADEAAVVAAMEGVDIQLTYTEGSQHILLNGVDVSVDIRRQEIGESASKISVYLPVRKKMVALQQAMAKKTSLVMDGRDIGTHVLTEATVKVFLTADVMVRAKRRYDQLTQKGESPNLEAIAAEIEARDERDMNREHAPLVQAEDAVLVDTSHRTIDEVVEVIRQLIERKA